MIWRIRIALLTSVVMASALCAVRADEKAADKDKKEPPPIDKKEPIPAPVPAPMPAPGPNGCGGCGAPTMQTICVTEWVPEYYKTTRTTYKKECVPETYTAYRTECVPETRTRNVTHYERVCETRQVTKTICEKVCVQEERTCMKAVWTCVPVTTYVCKTVDKGHWECKEVPCDTGCGSGGGFLSRLRGGHKHKGGDCGDPCADACNTCAAPPATKTVKVWVSCKVTEQVPCTRMERKCEMVPTKSMVSVWKSVPRTVTCNETFTKCVPVCKTETYTCNVSRCVPYQATRTVTRCVPCTEEVTCCRMVAKTVQKQVPVAPVCETSCNACETSCKPSLRDHLRGMGGRFGHKRGGDCGCETSNHGGGCGCH